MEVAQLYGVSKTDWTWSVNFGDLDNDGWEDWQGNWHYFPNWREEEAQTDPWDADSDDDGMSDGYEADH